jgi:hypothetical protein
MAVNRDGHTFVMVMDTANELREVRLDLSQRQNGHGQKYDQNLRPGQMSG